MKIDYRFENLESRLVQGGNNVFEGIKHSIFELDDNTTYYHFIGHEDNLWNNQGWPDKARKEIVPVRNSKNIKTFGLYYYTDWIVEKFGGEKIISEKRDMNFLPKGIKIPLRFYSSGNKVYYIFEDNNDFYAIEVKNYDFANKHNSLLYRLKNIDQINCFHNAQVNVNDGLSNQMIGIISPYIYLDLISKGINRVSFNNQELAESISKLSQKCKGVSLEILK